MNSSDQQHDDPRLLKERLRRLFEREHEHGAGGRIGERHALHIRECEREAAQRRDLVALADDDAGQDGNHRQHAGSERQQHAAVRRRSASTAEQIAVANQTGELILLAPSARSRSVNRRLRLRACCAAMRSQHSSAAVRATRCLRDWVVAESAFCAALIRDGEIQRPRRSRSARDRQRRLQHFVVDLGVAEELIMLPLALAAATGCRSAISGVSVVTCTRSL